MKRTMFKTERDIHGYRYGDSIVGEVVACDYEKCYVKDSRKGTVVCYKGCGERGDVVMLSVDRAGPGRGEVICRLDSVLEYAERTYEEYGYAV